MSTPFAGSMQIIGASGPVSGALIDTFVAGTLTPQAAYTTAALDVAQTNPVVCDATGRASLWLNPALNYRIRARNADGTSIAGAEWDNVSSAADSAGSTAAGSAYSEETFTATEGQLAFTLASAAVAGVDAVSVIVDGIDLLETDDWTLSGGTLITLASGLSAGQTVKVRSGRLVASGTEASAVSYTASGGVARSQSDRNADQISVFDFMSSAQRTDVQTYAGTLDVSDALIAAYAAASAAGMRVYEPAGKYRSTKPLTIAKGLTVEGAGTSPYDGALGTVGKGTWHHFDHAGKGFSIVGAASALQSTVTLRNLGTIRTQPTPGASWTPTVYDFDVYIDNCDTHLDDVMLLCPSHGVQLVNGNAGRLRTTNLRGQPFVVGIDISVSYDAPMLVNTHFWPFWRDDTNVHAYTMANLDALKLGRVDNPFISGFFSIFARAGWRLYQNASGAVSKLRAVNVDIDRCKLGIWIDNTVTSGITAQIDNFTHQGETGLADSCALLIDGTSSDLAFGAFDTQLCNIHGIDINATGNRVRVQTLTIANYNVAASSKAAIDVASGSLVYIGLIPKIINGSSGAKYAGAGLVFVDEWRTYTPTVLPSAGTITTVGTVNAGYKLWNDSCRYSVDATITTNGTGSGSIVISAPVGHVSGAPISIGQGLNNTSGVGLTAALPAASGNISVLTATGTYPGADGARLCIAGEFRV